MPGLRRAAPPDAVRAAIGQRQPRQAKRAKGSNEPIVSNAAIVSMTAFAVTASIETKWLQLARTRTDSWVSPYM